VARRTRVVAASVVLVLLFCIQVKKNNPLLPEYQGDYRLTISWNSLASDTLEMDTTYRVPCTIGVDTFAGFSAADAQKQFLDTAALSRSTNDTIVLYFTKEFSDTLTILGMQPNGKTVAVRHRLAVKNPKRPFVTVPATSEIGKGPNYIDVEIRNRDKTSVRVYWKLKSAAAWDSLSQPFTPGTVQLPVTETLPSGWDTLFVWSKNVIGGEKSDTARCALNIIGISPRVTAISIPDTVQCGDTLVANVTLGDTSVTSLFTVVIKAKNGTYADTSLAYSYQSSHVQVRMKKPVTDTSALRCSLYVADSSRVRSKSFCDTVFVKHTTVVLGLDTVVQAGLGENTTISLVDSFGTCRKFVWTFGASKPETTLVNKIVRKFIDTTGIRVSVFGVDRFGYRGEAVSARIVVRPFEYSLAGVAGSFPETIIAKHRATWKVAVNNPAKLSANGGAYYWKLVAGGVEIDTSGTLLDSFSATVADSVLTTISVQVKDTLDGSSPLQSSAVLVRIFKPTFKFEKENDVTRISKLLELKAHCFDSNPDGAIDSVFWDTNNDGKIDIENRDSTIFVSSAEATTLTVVGYARDNDGNYSAPDTMHIEVRSDRPSFNKPANDTIVYINSRVTLQVSAVSGVSNVPITTYFWSLRGAVTFDAVTTGPSYERAFSTEGRCTVTVTCRDADSLMSENADTFVVTVSRGNPAVFWIKPDSAWIFDTVTYTVGAREINPNGRLDSFFVQWEPGGAFEARKDSLFRHCYGTAGTKRLALVAKDNFGFPSDTAHDSVIVNLSRSVVDSIRADSTVFVLDARTYTVYSHATHGTTDSCRVFWNGASSSAQKTGVFTHVYGTGEAGVRAIKSVVLNGGGVWSDTFTQNVTVRLGKPVVTGIAVDTAKDSIFINDLRTFTITASDTNGTVDSIMVDSGNGAFGAWHRMPAGPFSFSRAFSRQEAGSRTIRAIVKDNDGIASDTFLYSFMARLGRPRMLGITKDSAAVFIRDPVTYTLSASDTNGVIKDWYLAWDSIDGFRQVPGGKVQTAFLNPGVRSVRAYAIDDDSLSSDTLTWQLVVRQGSPVVDSVRIDTSGNNIFVKDMRTYRVFCRDTNGSVRMIYAAWNNGASPDDSVSVNIAGGGFGTISHAYDTSLAGGTVVRFWVRDNDSVWSTAKDTAIAVRLGAPLLWGDAPAATGDTVWTIIDNGAGKPYRVRVSHYDTNGTIGKYYWNEADSTLGRQTATDTIMRNFSVLEINRGFPMWIYGRDDDGLTRGGKFIVFADSAPPAPVFLNPPLGDMTGLTLRWINDDVKDKDETYFQIMIGYGAGALPTTILQPYKQGKDHIRSGSEYRFTFTPSSPSFSIKIVAKDARGTTSESVVQTFSY
jgi:hypothetical protein